ncbi:MAG: hypothetical protein WKF79_15145, partial [Nocardioides sp.]
MFQAIEDLDPTATLARVGATVRRRRESELEDLLLVAQWADLHADDPRRGPGGRRVWAGEDRLVDIGGEGTPLVRELCLPELALARGCHTLAARSAMADVLDLRHRLPQIWAVLTGGGCETWVARKVAAMTRRLDQVQAALVDAAVADAIAGQSPSRVLRIAEAKIIEADLPAHQARLEAELRKRFVGCSPTDEHGLRMVYARVEAGDAVWIDAVVDQVADILATRPDLTGDLPATTTTTKDELRAVAFGWLAHPADLLDLLATTTPAKPVQRARGVVYVHLHQAALDGAAAVARVEDLGPILLDQVRRLLAHTNVTLKPVIDLNTGASVNAYEHPEAIAERVFLRHPGEVFPHATRTSRRVDLDHPDPYHPTGPPGQTGDHNTAPLSRTHHRAKTHLAYHLTQHGLDHYHW